MVTVKFWPSLYLVLFFLTAQCGAIPSPVMAQPAEPADPLTELADRKPLKPAPGDDELKRLFIARYNTALEEVQVRMERLQAGLAVFGRDMDMSDALKRFLEAELALATKPEDQIRVLQDHLKIAQKREKTVKLVIEAGQVGSRGSWTTADLASARYECLNLEIALVRAKQKLAESKK
jgi:ribosome-associated translation inhibitor RaiA